MKVDPIKTLRRVYDLSYAVTFNRIGDKVVRDSLSKRTTTFESLVTAPRYQKFRGAILEAQTGELTVVLHQTSISPKTQWQQISFIKNDIIRTGVTKAG